MGRSYGIVAQPKPPVYPLPVIPCTLESDAVLHASNEMASFREEVEGEHVFIHIVTEISPHGAMSHIVVVLTRLLGFVIDGEDTAVELFIIAIVVLLGFLIDEPGCCHSAVRMLKMSPVKLPSGIGP